MSKSRMARVLFVVGMVAGLAVSGWAQFGPQMPRIRGVWGPTVGSGAVYSMEGKGQKSQMEIAVVGTEAFAGKPGHWLEMVMKTPEGTMIMKTLMVADGGTLQPRRMIMQPPGDEPMEFPMEMMEMRGGPGGPMGKTSADIKNDAELVGTETITVPAGTFTCQHWRMKDKSGDVWVAENIAPYGVVKMTSKDGNMTLDKILSNATTKIKGTPRKFDPMEMMRQRP